MRKIIWIGVACVALLVALPAGVQAADPVKLELGGDGATPWSINNIAPGDGGTKTVTLLNSGSKDGLVTIWLSDIISGEGTNPPSETGDTAEPGELDKYLRFNLSCSRLSTNIALPATIDRLPQNFTDQGYIRIGPLNAGNTLTLVWQWELPSPTSNDVQGDTLSFTINYTLEELATAGPPPSPPPTPTPSMGAGGVGSYDTAPPAEPEVENLTPPGLPETNSANQPAPQEVPVREEPAPLAVKTDQNDTARLLSTMPGIILATATSAKTWLIFFGEIVALLVALRVRRRFSRRNRPDDLSKLPGEDKPKVIHPY